MGGTPRNTETIEKQLFSCRKFTVFASLPKNRFPREILVGKLEPARSQQEARKRPARGQQAASKRPAEASSKPARRQQDASKKPGRGQQRGGPHETPKPLKNSYFHEENSPFSRAFPKTDFLEKSSWGSLKPARSQQDVSKRPGRSQQEASKRPARSQQDASKRPARSQQEARKRPARGQQEARKKPQMGGTPRNTPKP